MTTRLLINLATGLEDPEGVTVAFLVAGAALERGETVAIWLTKDAVRLTQPDVAHGVACDGCPPLERLFEQFADGGGALLACPICVHARRIDQADLVPHARLAGASSMLEWVRSDDTTVFSF